MTTIDLPEGRFVAGTLPMYADVSLVTAERHGLAALLEDASFSFAADTSTVPLTADEFARAALDYPIVFVGPERHAFVVTSLEAERNIFIDADGAYRPGAYIPAYLRRHPFVLASDPVSGKWVLAIDEFSLRLAPLDDPAARPLFIDGQPSDATREAVAFCESYEASVTRTDTLVQLLDELDLFESRQAHHQPILPDGSPGEHVLLLDYVAICRERLEALDATDLAKLREIGGLEPIYAHLMSEANWERLAILGA